MRAMPSPTSRTRPPSPASSLAWYCSISCCKTETISLALNLMTASRDNLTANHIQTLSHRGIKQPVAHTNAHAAQQGCVNLGLHNRLQVKCFPNPLLQLGFLVIGQGHRRFDLYPDPLAALIVQFPVSRQDRPQQVQPFLVVEHQEEIVKQLAGPSGKHGLEDSGPC